MPQAGDAAAGPSGWALATAGMAHAPPVFSGDPRRAPLDTSELASWWARLGGYLLDGLLFGLVAVVVWVVTGVVAWMVDPGGIESMFDSLVVEEASSAAAAWDPAIGWMIAFVLTTFVTYVLWEVLWLRSSHMARPGQSIAGFRVVSAEGLERIGTGRAIGRCAAKLIYQVPYAGGLGIFATAFTIGLSNRKQALHDMMGGTVCVRKSALARRGIGPDASPQGTSPPPPPPPGTPPPRPASTGGPFV